LKAKKNVVGEHLWRKEERARMGASPIEIS